MRRRNVCCLPENNRFGPLTIEANDQNNVTMSVDEYETIRLIDLEGLTQAECAEQMGVARTTVQGIYSNARIKLAKSLVLERNLIITGGEYRLCGESSDRYCKNCHHRQRRGRRKRGRGKNL